MVLSAKAVFLFFFFSISQHFFFFDSFVPFFHVLLCWRVGSICRQFTTWSSRCSEPIVWGNTDRYIYIYVFFFFFFEVTDSVYFLFTLFFSHFQDLRFDSSISLFIEKCSTGSPYSVPPSPRLSRQIPPLGEEDTQRTITCVLLFWVPQAPLSCAPLTHASRSRCAFHSSGPKWTCGVAWKKKKKKTCRGATERGKGWKLHAWFNDSEPRRLPRSVLAFSSEQKKTVLSLICITTFNSSSLLVFFFLHSWFPSLYTLFRLFDFPPHVWWLEKVFQWPLVSLPEVSSSANVEELLKPLHI